MRPTVNFGDPSRTILAGIKKERGNPREIKGRQALFVLNLKPRKTAGEISEGMPSDIGHADRVTPVLLRRSVVFQTARAMDKSLRC
jgi:tRNA-binding protein